VAAPTIVIGLGNPGRRYEHTRHNVGFGVVERLAERSGAAFGLLAPHEPAVVVALTPGPELVLAKPRTFMNRSGRAAEALGRCFESTPAQMLLVYDDADLELGRVRIRPGGSAGGHRGVRSVMDALGENEIPRLKLGVRGPGRGDRELADYVLDPFDLAELPLVERMVETAADAVLTFRREGIVAAMNEFNRRPARRDVEDDMDQ
jgi:PTH1 family peptidyl-tRNA hydrolase